MAKNQIYPKDNNNFQGTYCLLFHSLYVQNFYKTANIWVGQITYNNNNFFMHSLESNKSTFSNLSLGGCKINSSNCTFRYKKRVISNRYSMKIQNIEKWFLEFFALFADFRALCKKRLYHAEHPCLKRIKNMKSSKGTLL